MSTLEAIGAVALAGIFGIIALYFSFRRELRRHGLEMFKLGEVFGMEKGMAEGMAAGIETGWNEGWDDRDKDRYPETPEPQGRHHGLSQPEDWIGNDLTEFLPSVDGTKLVNCKTSQDPDNPAVVKLPKRIPGASR